MNAKKQHIWQTCILTIYRFRTVLFFGFTIILFSVLAPGVSSMLNLFSIFPQIAPIGIVSLGVCIVIISGGVDLSVGSIVSLSSVITIILINDAGFSTVLACLLAIFLGALLGALNGLIISYIKLNSIIVTYLAMNVIQGAAYLLCNGRSITPLGDSLSAFGNLTLCSVPISFLIMVGVIVLFHLFLQFSYLGKNIYAVGGSPVAAKLAGINIRATITMSFTISGLLSGVGGVLLTARLNSGVPDIGQGYEFTALVVAMLSSIPLTSGRGVVLSVIMGALTYGTITSGLIIIGINAYIQKIILGSLVFLAAVIDAALLHQINTYSRLPGQRKYGNFVR